MSTAWHSEGRFLALTVKGEYAKQRILAALADEVSRKILANTSQNGLSLLALSQLCGTPAEAIDRRLRELVDVGLVSVIMSSGSSSGLVYRSVINQVNVRLDPAGVSVHLAVNRGLSQKRTRTLLAICFPEDERILADAS